jgi:HEAT repeat protein
MKSRYRFLLVLLAVFATVLAYSISRPRRPVPPTPEFANPGSLPSDAPGKTTAAATETLANNGAPPKASPSQQPPTTDQPSDQTGPLILQLTAGTDEEKKQAAHKLSRIGSATAAKALIAELDATNTIPVRAALLDALSKTAAEDATAPLISCLGYDTKYDVREAASASLKQNPSSQSIDMLLAEVRNRQNDPWFIRNAAKVFRGYNDPSLVPALNTALLASQTYSEVEMCAEALANIGTPDAASSLVSAALSFSSDNRRAALSAVSHVTRPNGVQRLTELDAPSGPADLRAAIATARLPFSGSGQSPR